MPTSPPAKSKCSRTSAEILNPAVTPPFQLDDENLSETVRLEHRVLDLRRLPMQRNLRLRHRAAMSARRYLDANGFVDIETPTLYKSTPEGAREFLVPSRIHHGQFYALPQSPQLFKQMLMMAGFDRYYQIVKCFRDEDLRADRQPEFTQIDVETSFLSELEIRELMEGLVHTMFKDVLDVELPNPFPIMTFGDAMRDYGSDKPDLRVPLKLTELTDLMKTGRLQAVPRRRRPPERPRRGAQRSGRSHADTQGDRRLHDVREDLRRRRPRLHQGERRRQGERGRPAVAGGQVSLARCAEGHPRAHRGPDRRPHFLRGRPRQGRQRRPGSAARQGRPRARPRAAGLEAVVGRRFPDVRVRRGQQDLGGAAPPVHRAEGRPRGALLDATRARRWRRPTTSC